MSTQNYVRKEASTFYSSIATLLQLDKKMHSVGRHQTRRGVTQYIQYREENLDITYKASGKIT